MQHRDKVTVKVEVSTWAKLNDMYTRLRERGISITRMELIKLLVEKYGPMLEEELLRQNGEVQ